jgi:S1-C subfamily serine protease
VVAVSFDLLSVIETKRAGETVTLTVVRMGKAVSISVTLGVGE